jgi:hypothetical protein
MKILDRLPITKDRMSLRFGDRFISARPDQILVWMSVHLPGVLEPEQSIPRFPALLDTGNNFGFSAAIPGVASTCQRIFPILTPVYARSSF